MISCIRASDLLEEMAKGRVFNGRPAIRTCAQCRVDVVGNQDFFDHIAQLHPDLAIAFWCIECSAAQMAALDDREISHLVETARAVVPDISDVPPSVVRALFASKIRS